MTVGVLQKNVIPAKSRNLIASLSRSAAESFGFAAALRLTPVQRFNCFNVLTMLTAILVAAGSSQRMGFDKLFATIAGEPVIAHAIRAFDRAFSVTEIIVVAREDRHDQIQKINRDAGFKKLRSIVTGGERRQDSVRAGLDRAERGAKYVAVHDAARPLITPEQIEGAFKQCRVHGAAALAQPVNDTLKRADADLCRRRLGRPASTVCHANATNIRPRFNRRRVSRRLRGRYLDNRRSLRSRTTRPQDRSRSR